jgi:NADH dehydrogenase
MQMAIFSAHSIIATLKGRPRGTFRYFDKGIMATIGRSRAIAQVAFPTQIKMSGFLAWLAWLFVHVWYLIGFRNRTIVLFEWFWSYVTYKRGARLITPGLALKEPPALEPAPRESGSHATRTSEPRATSEARVRNDDGAPPKAAPASTSRTSRP